MFEFQSPTKTTVKSGKYGPYAQTKREATSLWVLNPEAEGVPTVQVSMTTHHDPDSKVFRTSLTWETQSPAEPGSVFSVITWGSDHHMVQVARTPVARYSKKALEAEHAEALKVVEEAWLSNKVQVVFAQAIEKNGLEVAA